MTNKTIQTETIHRTINLVKECIATQAIGVVSGLNGVGKTTALKFIERRYDTLDLPGVCVYHRCCQTAGPTKGLKDVLIQLGRRDLAFRCGISLQLMVEQARALFKSKNIRVLLLDEADTWASDSLNGVMTLQDICGETDHSLTLILAGVKPTALWIGGAGISRTLRVESFSTLTLEHTLAVLRKWDDAFEQFAKKVSNDDAEAVRLAKLIHKNTSGNLRRLKFFTELFLMSHQVVDANSVAQTFEKVMYEKI